ncbi:hypothetical protein MSG28_014411 [Choristoneura fumiferana]|uniref:Uncharacterized protein n=1 Tax=Choristoneura fumiferana TaxID=7141 RepID=A0ACC0JRL9_CHOFU|nr:hypothetical protein MSG28_014411 [Choristoneura fumiferana]
MTAVCSESSASESSLESSSGYGSQGAFAAEDHAHQHQIQHPEDSEIVTLRRDSDANIAAARESFSISLGSLEEAVRSLDETCETPAFATIEKKPAVPKRRPVSMTGKKPAVPKRRPVSMTGKYIAVVATSSIGLLMRLVRSDLYYRKKPSVPKRRPVSTTAGAWSRRGSSSSQGKPPPPVRRSSSISRPQRPAYVQGNNQNAMSGSETEHLPPPPAFLLQPESDSNPVQALLLHGRISEQDSGSNPGGPCTRHKRSRNGEAADRTETHAGLPGLVRRTLQQTPTPNPPHTQSPTQPLTTFQQAKSNFSSSTSLNSTGNLNPIYGQTGHRIMAYVEQNSIYVRKNSLNSSSSDLYGGNAVYSDGKGSPHGSSPSTPSYGRITRSQASARGRPTNRITDRRHGEVMAVGAEKFSNGDRAVRRPPTKWTDDLVKAVSLHAGRFQRRNWRSMGEACLIVDVPHLI